MTVLNKSFESLSRTITDLAQQLAISTAENVDLTLELSMAHTEIQALRSKIANPPPALTTTLSGKSKAVDFKPNGKRSIRKPASIRTTEDDHEDCLPKVPAGYRKAHPHERIVGAYWFDDRERKWRIFDDSPAAYESFYVVPLFASDLTSEAGDVMALAPTPLNNKDGKAGYRWNTYLDVPRYDTDIGDWIGSINGVALSVPCFSNDNPKDGLIVNPLLIEVEYE